MRIFITGATGFLGKRVLTPLKGHQLLCLSRNPQDHNKLEHVDFISGDLANSSEWEKALKNFAPDCCLHLAWEGLPDYSLSYCRSNLDASIGFIEMLADSGIKRIVVAGTCWEYGSATGAVKEGQIASNCGLFATTKRSLQMILESVARDRKFEYAWARIFFSYGPGQRATSLIAQCHSAYSQGKTPEIRCPSVAQDFVYVDDVASGLAALVQARTDSGIFNIGSGTHTTIAAVVNRVARHFDKSPLFSSQKTESGFWADTSKMMQATGWRPQIGIDEGIEKTLRALDGQS